jgi:GR25 family glycosyltransferase involved in LPS biosynthesis|tara:strand:+ start:180 stop:848 length:669 start_codon:yes stop_codon:yes gene_type:complete
MKGKGPSEDLATDCIKSGKAFNIDIQLFDAVWGNDVEIEYQKYKLFPFENIKSTRNTKGVKGCFLSHYKLWKKSFDENIPLLIFEHDAELIRPIPLEEFNKSEFDVLNLDAYTRSKINYIKHLDNDCGPRITQYINQHPKKNGFSLYDNTHIKGLHSYIIRPSGAAKLIEATKIHGVLPADIAVNSIWCKLFRTETSYCRLNPKSWKDENKKAIYSYTKSER